MSTQIKPFFAGDTLKFDVTVTDPALITTINPRGIVDINTATFSLIVNDMFDRYLFTKTTNTSGGIVINSPTTLGTVTITLLPTDTISILYSQELRWMLRMILNNETHVVADGTIEVQVGPRSS